MIDNDYKPRHAILYRITSEPDGCIYIYVRDTVLKGTEVLEDFVQDYSSRIPIAWGYTGNGLLNRIDYRSEPLYTITKDPLTNVK